MKPKAVLSWSGGKDSALALAAVRGAGQFEIEALVTTVIEGRERIGMHDVPRQLVQEQARSLRLPLREVRMPYRPANNEYEQRLGEVLAGFKQSGVTHVIFGDLFLEDIKTYRDAQMARMGLTPVYPVWGKDTRLLAEEFIEHGFKAILVCVDAKVLDRSFAGRMFDKALLRDLPASADPCGENGEFHTFVYDGPGFERAVMFEKGVIREEESFYFCDLIPFARPSDGLKHKTCPQCGTSFSCGPEPGEAHCWCHALPHVMPLVPGTEGCLCPDCLKRAVAAASPARPYKA